MNAVAKKIIKWLLQDLLPNVLYGRNLGRVLTLVNLAKKPSVHQFLNHQCFPNKRL